MTGMEGIGKALLIMGLAFAFIGLVLIFGGRIPFFGKLPGDIMIQRGGFTFYFPIVTFILLSLVLTIVLNVIFGLFRK
ncbi:MAG: DUF2905 domain-containing protein [Chloroflexi bacterium]|nr:DUF2905 domain-containing protein [Chloroflexota bacterium]